jgi:hypothetical protein
MLTKRFSKEEIFSILKQLVAERSLVGALPSAPTSIPKQSST